MNVFKCVGSGLCARPFDSTVRHVGLPLHKCVLVLILLLVCAASPRLWAEEGQGTSKETAQSKEDRSNQTAPAPSPAEVRAFVDKSSITIGEKVTYAIEVDADKAVTVTFPSYVANLGGFVVKDFGVEDPKKSGRNRIKQSRWYLLDTYTVGSYVIPPQEVRVMLADGKEKVLKSPEIFVEVKGVMNDESGKEEGLRDIKPPINISRRAPVLWIVLSVLALTAPAGGLAWYFYRKKKEAKTAVPPRPAHEVAFEELNRIEGLDLIRQRQIKEYYYLTSNCLRQYLENRFNLRAPEQTTEEFLESAARNGTLEGRFVNLLKEYLERCDLVKYAKLEPHAGELTKLVETTRKFIEETKPVEAAPLDEEDTWQEEAVS